MKNRFINRLLPLLLSAIVLQGCGQKGPLYLPADKQAQPAAVTDSEPTESTENQDKDGSL